MVRELRILVVGPSLDPPGGQSVQAAGLVSWLGTEASLRVSFLPINPRLPGPLDLFRRVKYVRTLAVSCRYLASLLLAVPRHDIVHVFAASYWSFLLAPAPAILLGRIFRKKVLLNYHSGEADDHLARWPSATRFLRLADSIVVPSSYLVDVFRRYGLQARSIFNGIDFGRYRFRPRAPLRPRLLTNRSFESLYNVQSVLRAFALIEDAVPDASLVVAGGGSQRKALEELSLQLGLRRVVFLGVVTPNNMPELYDSADILLNGSDIDNMPLCVLEAFAAGVVVVSTKAGGIPWMVADGLTGLLVDRGDHTAMAAAVVRVLGDPDLAWDLAARASGECCKYSWEAVGPQWVALYRELCGCGTEPASAEPPVAAM